MKSNFLALIEPVTTIDVLRFRLRFNSLKILPCYGVTLCGRYRGQVGRRQRAPEAPYVVPIWP
jgi:hypothetical protein